MDRQKQELSDRLERAAERMYKQSRTAAMKDWSGIDLTMPQLRALGYLSDAPRRMSDIAAFLGSSVSSATSLVERLEGKSLVERVHDPVDRRVVMCHLTETGRAELDRVWRAQRLHREMLVDVLTLDELVKVVEVMELIGAAFERQKSAQAGTGSLNESMAPGQDLEAAKEPISMA